MDYYKKGSRGEHTKILIVWPCALIFGPKYWRRTWTIKVRDYLPDDESIAWLRVEQDGSFAWTTLENATMLKNTYEIPEPPKSDFKIYSVIPQIPDEDMKERPGEDVAQVLERVNQKLRNREYPTDGNMY